MLFETYTPNELIASDIESIFHYKGFIPDHSIERVVPTGHVFILFELDGMQRNTFNNITLEPISEYSKVWISGMHRGHISISAHENSEMLVIQFKPYGSYPFTHIETEALNEQVVSVDGTLGDSLLKLREDMLATNTSKEKFELVDSWLLDRFDQTKQAPQELKEFVSVLQNQPVTKLNNLVEEYLTTQKNLIDQFKKHLGITPKAYQRIVRFNELLKKIQQDQAFSWAEVAYDCGYSDQSHFIREFQTFSGMKPGEFLKQGFNEQEPNFFPLDR